MRAPSATKLGLGNVCEQTSGSPCAGVVRILVVNIYKNLR